VEVALSPFGIAGHGSWLVSCCERTTVKCINIGVEDYAPPPGPAPRLRSLKYCGSGGAPLPLEVAQQFAAISTPKNAMT